MSELGKQTLNFVDKHLEWNSVALLRSVFFSLGGNLVSRLFRAQNIVWVQVPGPHLIIHVWHISPFQLMFAWLKCEILHRQWQLDINQCLNLIFVLWKMLFRWWNPRLNIHCWVFLWWLPRARIILSWSGYRLSQLSLSLIRRNGWNCYLWFHFVVRVNCHVLFQLLKEFLILLLLVHLWLLFSEDRFDVYVGQGVFWDLFLRCILRGFLLDWVDLCEWDLLDGASVTSLKQHRCLAFLLQFAWQTGLNCLLEVPGRHWSVWNRERMRRLCGVLGFLDLT